MPETNFIPLATTNKTILQQSKTEQNQPIFSQILMLVYSLSAYIFAFKITSNIALLPV